MSPEQAKGSGLDFRSDIFAFGAILYEMVAGHAAFQRATTIETLTAILHEQPRPVAELNEHIPLPLQWIVQRCLAKAPEERYAATADLHHDLRLLRDRLPGVPAGGLSGRRTARLPWMAILAGAAAISAGAAFLSSSAVTSSAADLRAYRITPFATDAAYEGSPAWSPDGRTIAYVAERDGLMQVMTRAVDASMPVQITRAVADCRRPFWSADGTRVYYISLAGERESLWSVGRIGGTPRMELHNVSNAALSPDGRAIVFLREEDGQAGFKQKLWVSAPAGADPQPFAPDWVGTDVAGISFLRFSPDGSLVALWADSTAQPRSIRHNQVEVWLFDFPAGQARRVLASVGEMTRAHPFAWMPDNRHLVFGAEFPGGSPGTHLWIGETTTDAVAPLTMSSTSEYEPDVSPDGRRIAFTTDASHYDVVEILLDGSAPRPKMSTVRDEADPVWSATGRHFAYVTDRSGAPEIWLRDEDGTMEQPIVHAGSFTEGSTYLLSRPAFSPDGERVAFQRRSARQAAAGSFL